MAETEEKPRLCLRDIRRLLALEPNLSQESISEIEEEYARSYPISFGCDCMKEQFRDRIIRIRIHWKLTNQLPEGFRACPKNNDFVNKDHCWISECKFWGHCP